MIFHENCLSPHNSHEISYLIFFRKLGKIWQNLSSAAVVIDALSVKAKHILKFQNKLLKQLSLTQLLYCNIMKDYINDSVCNSYFCIHQ